MSEQTKPRFPKGELAPTVNESGNNFEHVHLAPWNDQPGPRSRAQRPAQSQQAEQQQQQQPPPADQQQQQQQQ